MPGPRVYTVDEIDALVPVLEEKFVEMDELRARIKASKIRADAIEIIWGEQIHRKDCPDHGEFQHYLDELRGLEERFQKIVASFSEYGATVKGLEPGLLDFYGLRDGRLVFLCWRRGESRCEYWHHVDAGFSGRQPIR